MASTCEVQEQLHNSNTITLQALPPSEQSRNSVSDSPEDAFAALEKWNEPRINQCLSLVCYLLGHASDGRK